MKSLLPAAFFLLVNLLRAQPCDNTFIRRIGNPSVVERAFKILPAPNGNLFIGGGKGNAALLVLAKPDGTVLWERSFDTSSGDDFIFDMFLDGDGHLAIVGRDHPVFPTNSFAMRYDFQNHVVLWSRRMSSPSTSRFEHISEMPNGNYLVMGTTTTSSTAQDNLILEINRATGATNWLKSFNNGNTDVFLDAVVKNGAIYTANVQRYGGLEKIRAASSKLDLTGNQVWTNSYWKDVAGSARTYFFSVASTNDTLVYFGHGDMNGSVESNYTLQLLTTDLNGNPIMGKDLQLPGNTHNAGEVIPLPDGYLLIGNYSKSLRTEIFAIKLDKQGNKVWAKDIGSAENEIARSATVQNGYIYFVGHSDYFDTSQDILFGKMSMQGEITWPTCNFAKDVQATATNIANPYVGANSMASLTVNYTVPAISTSGVSVSSNLTDVPACGCQAVPTCDNVLVNSNFENGLSGWSTTGDVTSTSDAHAGTGAAKICGTAAGSLGQIYPAQPGESYSASVWAKTGNPPSNANAQLRFLNSAFSPIASNSDQQYFYSATYSQYNLSAIAPPGTAYVHFLIWKQGTACVFIDDMEICKEIVPTAQPDLTVSGVAVLSNPVMQGSNLPIEYTLSNLGTGAANGSYKVKFYLSTTNTLNQFSILLTTLTHQNTPVGYTANLSASPTLPLSLNPGNYYLVAVVDADGNIAESNESNNTAATGQTFVVQQTTACNISASVTEVSCSDNGTAVSTDDLMNFKLLATATNSISVGYQTLVLQTNQNYNAGTYGTPLAISGIPISTGNLTVKLTDNSNTICTTTLVVTAPATCSNSLADLVPSNLVAPNTALSGSGQTYSYTVTNIGTAAAVGQSGLNNYLYLSTDNQFSASDVLVANNSFPFNFQPNGTAQYGPLNFSIPIGTQAGNYFLILLIDQGQIVPESNESNNMAVVPITVQSPPSGDNIDLSLTVTSPSSAPIYTNYPVTIKITNSGSIPATGVRVVCQKPNGVVYTGGNEYTASQGSFGVFTNQEWSVGSLAPGATATLTVNYFLLQNSLPTVYAQVTAANETDTDSSPNNGTPPTPIEDDEASSAGAPPPPPPAQPDLTLSDLVAPTTIGPGTGNFTFTLKNIGSAAVQGNYQIGSFLSTDNVLSANDYAFATLPESNTAVGSFPRTGSFLLPVGFAPGNYYLIVKADVGSAIAESNENNNTVSSPVTIPGVSCDGNYILSTQAQVNAFPSCPVVSGNLRIAGADIVDLSPLSGLTQVTGLFEINNNTSLPSLQGLNNIASVGGLMIGGNPLLTSLAPLSNLHHDAILPLTIDNNPLLTNLNGLQGITGANYLRINGNAGLQTLTGLNNLAIVRGEFLVTNNSSLQNFDALTKLTTLQSTLIMDDNPLLASLNGLSNLKTIGGTLFLYGTNSLLDLQGLQNLTSLFGIDIKDNTLLQNLDALSGITALNSLRVRNNAVLSDCCGLYPVLSANGVSGVIEIQGNPNGCNNQLDIINSCVPQGGVDLQLTMTTTIPNPPIYSNFPVKLTITNTGGQAATGVKVHFPRPTGVVYVGGNEFTLTQGGFNAFGNEQWFVGNLAAGASASLTVNYFLLTSNALQPYAQVVGCDQADSDSSPNNGTSPNPSEDDEATLSINGFAGNNSGTSLAKTDNRQRLVIDWVYPNPTKYLVNLEVFSPEEQPAVLDFYDQQGRVVYSLNTELEEGTNNVQVFVFDWKSGTYNVIARGEKTGLPAYGRFLKVWEE